MTSMAISTRRCEPPRPGHDRPHPRPEYLLRVPHRISGEKLTSVIGESAPYAVGRGDAAGFGTPGCENRSAGEMLLDLVHRHLDEILVHFGA